MLTESNSHIESGRQDRISRVALAFILGLMTLFILATGVTASEAGQGSKPHRVGGKVKKAWPATGTPPRQQLAKWLARQVGPVKNCRKKKTTGTRQARKRSNAKRRQCLKRKRRAGAAGASTASSAETLNGDPGAPALRAGQTAAASIEGQGKVDPTLLVRSFQIPKDDPDYERLHNWSWTYDTTVAAAAFIALDEKAQAGQLLDQLSALQFSTGAIDIAFNVASGEGAGLYRSGNVAWLGLAAITYDLRYKDSRYSDTARRSANFLLSYQQKNGLIRGGPQLSWYSTLHNLVAYTFFARMAEANPKGDSRYPKAAKQIADAIENDLLIDDKTGPHFIQGLNDGVEPLDVQSIGAMYLAGRDQKENATQVVARIPEFFGAGKRTIELSKDPETYNMTWSSPDTFAGFEPYRIGEKPSVLWYEGAAQVRAATAVTGGDTKALDQESKKWREVTAEGGGTAPLQANETALNAGPGGEVQYHVWPAAAGAAWSILSTADPQFFNVPIP